MYIHTMHYNSYLLHSLIIYSFLTKCLCRIFEMVVIYDAVIFLKPYFI